MKILHIALNGLAKLKPCFPCKVGFKDTNMCLSVYVCVFPVCWGKLDLIGMMDRECLGLEGKGSFSITVWGRIGKPDTQKPSHK